MALKGARDGHDFIPTALQKDCAGVIGQHVPENWSKGFVEVPDTLEAFKAIAHWTRSRFNGPVIGITGSAGKTTTRALVASVLESLGTVHQTAGNFNNHIGLPKTITDAPENSDAWVLEMGMSALGEIDLLQRIAEPTIRLITNIGTAHIEGCGSIEGVAQAKGELFAGARPGDICCVNMDDHRVASLPIPTGATILRYGSTEDCDIRLLSFSIQGWNSVVDIQTPLGRIQASIPVPGEFMALNACAAIAVGISVGLNLAQCKEGLARYKPVGMRMRKERIGDVIFINDSYNANPLSMKAALRSLLSLSERNSLAILGDMLEMGVEEEASHIEILDFALNLGVNIALVGPRFRKAWEQSSSEAKHNVLLQASSSEELAALLLAQKLQMNIILLKGSRGIKMERIAEIYREQQ